MEQDAPEGGRQGWRDVGACQAHQQLEPCERSQVGVRDAGNIHILPREDTLPPRTAPALLKSKKRRMQFTFCVSVGVAVCPGRAGWVGVAVFPRRAVMSRWSSYMLSIAFRCVRSERGPWDSYVMG